MANQVQNDKEILASNLTFYRKNAKLTQLELAEKFNYSDKAVSKWERGESAPDVFVLRALATFYGISLNDFFRAKPKEPKHVKNNLKHFIISLLSIGICWLVATIIFVLIGMSAPDNSTAHDNAWMTYIAAIPVSCILGIVFSSVWGNKLMTLGFVSALCWTVILTLYLPLELLTDFHHMYLLWIIPIPLQIMAILWYLLKSNLLFKNRKNLDEEK